MYEKFNQQKNSPFNQGWLEIAQIGIPLLMDMFGGNAASNQSELATANYNQAAANLSGQQEMYFGSTLVNPFANMTNQFADAQNKFLDMGNYYGQLDNQFAGLGNQYAGMSNQFAGLENVMEDATINQQQAEFERNMFQQSQANMLGDLRGAAGGSGVAALAQQLAQSGQIASQQASASIGQQEATNQRNMLAEASRLQGLEAGEASRIDQMQRGEASRLDMARAQGQSSLDMAWAGQQQGLDMAAAQGATTIDQMTAQQQGLIDQMVAEGDWGLQQMNLGRLETGIEMSQAEMAAYLQQQSAANTGMWESISSGAGGIMDLMDWFGENPDFFDGGGDVDQTSN